MVAWSVVGLAVPTWAYEELILNAKEGEVNTQYPAYLVTVPNASGYQSHQAIEFSPTLSGACYVWHRILPVTYSGEMGAILLWYPTTTSTDIGKFVLAVGCTAVGESLLGTVLYGGTVITLTGGGTTGVLTATTNTTAGLLDEVSCAAGEVMSLELCRQDLAASTLTVRIPAITIRYPCSGGSCP